MPFMTDINMEAKVVINKCYAPWSFIDKLNQKPKNIKFPDVQ
jgi:hypothetical protein